MMTLKKGTLLHNGTYRIVSKLGQGGFGITYLALHLRLKKHVAIKEFFPSTFCKRDHDTSQVSASTDANTEMVDRLRKKFIKEAEHIGEMHSPYIVGIIDVFEENSTAYYVMDYIEGSPLSDIIKNNGPLPPQQAVEYIAKIGEALTHIHSKHMNHLDVKPANIMIRRSDNTPILVDFGLSKQYDSRGIQTSTTPVGLSHGYAPMEQYKDGGVKDFSPQTDLYSLAATLLYLITGQVPPQAPDIAEDGLTIPPTVPPHLVAPITKAMMTSRKKRHESVAAFVSEIQGTDPAKAGGGTPTVPHSARQSAQTVLVNPDKDKFKNAIITIIFITTLIITTLVSILIVKNNDNEYDNDDLELADTLAVTEVVVDTVLVEATEAPLSYGEQQEGLGGYDDNAEGYFSMHADTYMTENRAVYFDGKFYNSTKTFPISLKFELDDNYFAGVCYYTNIDYNQKLKMSVRFTEEEMIITGTASGSEFKMIFKPTTDGSWSGTAINGNTTLRATITPVHI